jgi:hypothetical protein
MSSEQVFKLGQEKEALRRELAEAKDKIRQLTKERDEARAKLADREASALSAP